MPKLKDKPATPAKRARWLIVPGLLALSACSYWATEPDVSTANTVQSKPLGPTPEPTPERHEPRDSKASVSSLDLWQAIGIELQMASTDGRDPLAHFGNSRDFIRQAAERARPFLQYIVDAVAERELPYEIALLPVIESAYNPLATSPNGAAGLWQFMPATARRYELEISRWYDARRDPVASTRAALDYLEHLRDRFQGDWWLAFAAYNCGERTVERAIERNQRLGQPHDFHALDLPRQTREYVPRLMALVEIVAHPAAYDIDMPVIPATPYFESVNLGPGLDLNEVVRWTDVPVAEFEQLNAAFLKRFTIDGVPSTVHVPKGVAQGLLAKLAELPETARGQARVHVVSAGETLSHISATSGVPVSALKAANGLRSTRLSIGQELRIPQPAEALALLEPARVQASEDQHVIRDGDNLWDIARLHGTSVEALRAVNKLPVGQFLQPGQKLTLPGEGRQAGAGTTAAAQGGYEVRRGDSLWTIAKRFKVSVAELRRWNAIASGQLLQPGQQLIIAPQPTHTAAQDL